MLTSITILFLLLYALVSHVETSCMNAELQCVEMSECFLECGNNTGVDLINYDDRCSGTKYLYSNLTGNLLNIDTNITGSYRYSCCHQKKLVCSNTVIVFEKPVEANDVSCVFEIYADLLFEQVISTCTINQNGSFNLSLTIRQYFSPNGVPCNKTEESGSIFHCDRFNAVDLDKDHIFTAYTASTYDTTMIVKKDFEIIPILHMKHKKLAVTVIDNQPESVSINVRLPNDDYILDMYDFNFDDTYTRCIFDISYIKRSGHMSNISYEKDVNPDGNSDANEHNQTVNNLSPNSQYIMFIKWKYVEDHIWSYAREVLFNTTVGVPNTAPLVVNHAAGKGFTGLYIQFRPEDLDYGPIKNYVLHRTARAFTASGQRVRRNNVETFEEDYEPTVFVQSSETNETVTLRLETTAGVSPNYTTVYLPLNQENHISSLVVQRFNETHDMLTLEDVTLAESLYIYSCYGEYLIEKSLVDCKNSVETYEEIKPPLSIVILPRPKYNSDKNCSQCQLHYAAALTQGSETSPMFWDSNTVLKLKPDPQEEKNLIIIISVSAVCAAMIIFMVSVCCYRHLKEGKKKTGKITVPTIFNTINYTQCNYGANYVYFPKDIQIANHVRSDIGFSEREFSSSLPYRRPSTSFSMSSLTPSTPTTPPPPLTLPPGSSSSSSRESTSSFPDCSKTDSLEILVDTTASGAVHSSGSEKYNVIF